MAEPTSLKIAADADVQVVGLTTSSAVSAAIATANAGQPALTSVVRVVANADCWIQVGAAPVAVAAVAPAIFLPAGAPEYIDVPLGQKIAGIVGTGTGTLSIARMSKS